MPGKRKAATAPWTGTEEQLCRAVKRLQTESVSRTSSASQLTESEQHSVQGGKVQVHSQLQHESSLDDVSSQMVHSARLPARSETPVGPQQGATCTAAVSSAAAHMTEKPTVARPGLHTEAATISHMSTAPHTTGTFCQPTARTDDACGAVPESSAAVDAQPNPTSQRQLHHAPVPHLPQSPALSLTIKAAQPFAGQSRMIFANPVHSVIKPTRAHHRAARRSGAEPLINMPAGLTCNTLANSGNDADDEDSSSEVQQPSTPGREEISSPGLQRSSARLGKRSNSSTELHASYEWLYEETNALLKNLHFQRAKRIATDRDA